MVRTSRTSAYTAPLPKTVRPETVSREPLPPHLGLASNPFEPAGAGVPLYGSLRPPAALEHATETLSDLQRTGSGVKSLLVVGDYGMGKSCLLHWLQRRFREQYRVRSFYFDNPGVHFYALADSLLRTLGRKDFAKTIWELVRSHVPVGGGHGLFRQDFEVYLDNLSKPHPNRPKLTLDLQRAVLSAGLSENEEVANCLARIVTDVVRKPYFQYRDFVPHSSGSLVPEQDEPAFFRSILRTIEQASGAHGIAFLIDEFEEIGLQRRLTRRAAHDYLATLKHLIDLSQSHRVDFWIVLSMTPAAYKVTEKLDPALMARVSTPIEIGPLSEEDARTLVRERLRAVRLVDGRSGKDDLFPFPQDLGLSPRILVNPRQLVKVCFRIIAGADQNTAVPFEGEYLQQVEREVYPETKGDNPQA